MKMKIITLLFSIVLLFCSCGSEYSINGYENFETSHSHYELNNYILPTINFADVFENIGVDYYYNEEYKAMHQFVERSFLAIHYEKEIYEKAKEYCLQNMQLSDCEYMEYNGYIFIENIELAVKQNRYENPGSFPHWFNMFAYNDNMSCLIFMGFFSPEYTPDDAEDIRDNWGQFIENHFSDNFDWKKKRNGSAT